MNFRRLILCFVAPIIFFTVVSGQEVPYGINYQAVARDSYGEELANRQIDVRFSILSGTPLGNLEYQEIHTNITTSVYGIFSVVIGSGTPVAGAKEMFRDITWELDNHFVKVEIKFASDYLDMGTMKFLSVPFALYAGRSLEPGPEGPQGPPGDPATDDQTLSFDGTILGISGGNTVSLSGLVNNPQDEIQYLSIQDNSLSISGGNSIELQKINIDDADADPTNEIQTLSFNSVDSKLTLSREGGEADLTLLKNTDNQELNYNNSSYQLTIDNANSVSLGKLVAFRSVLDKSILLPNNFNHTLVFDGEIFDEGGDYNTSTGLFTPPEKGNYTFDIKLTLPFGSSSVAIVVDGAEYEVVIGPTASLGTFRASITLRLLGTEDVSLIVRQTNGFSIDPYNISGSFSGFRVY